VRYHLSHIQALDNNGRSEPGDTGRALFGQLSMNVFSICAGLRFHQALRHNYFKV